MVSFTQLVLSGGGPKGFNQLGALQYLYEKGYLKEIQDYWGTSIGSVICLLIAVGFTPMDILYELIQDDKFIDKYDINTTKLWNGIGIIPIEQFGNKIRNTISKKIGQQHITFQELYDLCSIKLHVSGTNLDKMTGEIFDVESHPNMDVVTAVEISCCLPFIFTKKIYNGFTYADGGFYNNYLIDMADNKKEYVIGVYVDDAFKRYSRIDGFLDWIYRLFIMPVHELHEGKLSRASDKVFNIRLYDDNIQMNELNFPIKKRIKTYVNGYSQCMKFVEQSPFIQAFHKRNNDENKFFKWFF